LLDAGCGTGASTAALLSVAPEADIIAVDASRGMLDEARAKSWPASVRFVHAPIEATEALADNGVVGPFDGILAAYLIRNLADPDTSLRALRNLLAPGATLAVHDYSVRDSHTATWIWHAVCWGIIIPSGWRQTRDATLYRHLWRSVLTFDGATEFRQRMGDAGFISVHSETMPGWETNIVHTFLGDAPR
jgi:ubiquinone/menaquinone biosynthesis C-methylase UbiE